MPALRTLGPVTSTVGPESVAFFFDPMCPWAYQTSRWMREVRDRLGLDVRWRFFSLEEINRQPGKPHPWERPWAYGWSQMRIGAWLRRESMAELDRWYAMVGAAFFERGERTFDRAVHARLLADHDFDPDIIAAALADATTADEVRADHDEVRTRHGGHGVPTLVFADGHALFGPVVVPAPTGDAAMRLWDLVTGWREFPHLYELRQPKTGEDLAHIAEHFTTYLNARAWQTIQTPAP
ncbi:DsbA family protein [soil metagenome]